MLDDDKVYGSVGDRVRLVRTDDAYTMLRPGSCGVIDHIDGTGTRFVRWEDGSTLGLLPGVDCWTVLDD